MGVRVHLFFLLLVCVHHTQGGHHCHWAVGEALLSSLISDKFLEPHPGQGLHPFHHQSRSLTHTNRVGYLK